jgi:hypothetical protein
VQGPGTAIAGSLEVPEGARLLGTAFPRFAAFVTGHADIEWTAVLQVDGDGRRSFDALVSQAQAAGYTTSRASDPAGCDGSYPTTGVACSAHLEKADRWVDIRSEVGACGPLGATHLHIVSTSSAVTGPPSTLPSPTTLVVEPPPTSTPLPDATGSTSLATTTVTTTAGPATTGSIPRPVPPPDPSPSLPQDGDLLNPRDDGVIAPVRLLPGSQLVGRPFVSCVEWPYAAAVVAITGGLDEVVDTYADQFARQSGERAVIRSAQLGGRRVTSVIGSQAGGDSWSLTIVDHNGQPTFGLVETSTDP